MNMTVSQNTQAILLLTAPLIVGRGASSSDPLTLGEYKLLARFLRDRQQQPSDLISPNAGELLRECQHLFDVSRLTRLLGRGFLLSQAIERWQARAIWVVSRADADYPKRIKARLGEDAPPVLYGCGNTLILDTGGLAVVGSRHVDDELINYTDSIGRLAAAAQCTLVSGGARGIDQAAMRGALEAGGKVTGVLADSLERAVLLREHRDLLMNGQLSLISPYDPAAGFNVGHAMQRNKLIYALADAALVVSSDYEKGGTWAGAVEQLDKFRFVPVYIRSNGRTEKGLESLGKKGAIRWPNPMTPESLTETLAATPSAGTQVLRQQYMSFDEPSKPREKSVDDRLRHSAVGTSASSESLVADSSPAEELFAKVRELLTRMDSAKTEGEIAEDLKVSKTQAREWLQRLVDEGILERLSKPIRYRPVSLPQPLFSEID